MTDQGNGAAPKETVTVAPLLERFEAIVVNDDDDVGRNPSRVEPLSAIIVDRMRRRTVLRGLMAGAALGAAATVAAGRAAIANNTGPSTLTFKEPKHVILDSHQVADGYRADILIRWGDPVVPGAPTFDPNNQTEAAQEKQFGYNNDFIGFLPLPSGSQNAEHGLLAVNHEYTNPELMFAGWFYDGQTPEQTAIEMAAHGMSVVEVRKAGNAWSVVPDSRYARRITGKTQMRISGPAAGHPRMKTGYDPSGTSVLGMFNNCAGGKTPWGTVLTAEENFHGYFGGALPSVMQDQKPVPHREKASHERYGIEAKARYPWHKVETRLDVSKEPNEPNRFGWMVEIDPYDPTSLPVKRTAMGRFKHEGAHYALNKDGRVVFYQGDDEQFEYLYKFVTAGRLNSNDRAANRNLLDSGVLYVARFNAGGGVEWLPLAFGAGPLTPANGFSSQADVLIEARRAADLLGATPMDRPEDVEPNPVTGKIYVMLTNNTKRKVEQVDGPNPRPANNHGQIVEIIPTDGDHAALTAKWELLLLAGNPAATGSDKGVYHPATQVWISAPDNCAFDRRGRLWISTDQGSAQRKNNIPDGMYACDLEGSGRALVKFFFGCPRDAEMCGPEFTPDSRTLFVAPQHPGEATGSTFENPSTRWPDFKAGMPPRPSVVAITKSDGGEIGT